VQLPAAGHLVVDELAQRASYREARVNLHQFDLLDDIATVLGADRGTRRRCQPRTSRPGCARWRRTGRPTGRSTGGNPALPRDPHAVKVPTTGHRYPMAPAAIREAIARRDVNRASDGAP
jgi:hypothetical protein